MTSYKKFVNAMSALFHTHDVLSPSGKCEVPECGTCAEFHVACEAYVNSVCEVRVINEAHYHYHADCHTAILKDVFGKW